MSGKPKLASLSKLPTKVTPPTLVDHVAALHAMIVGAGFVEEGEFHNHTSSLAQYFTEHTGKGRVESAGLAAYQPSELVSMLVAYEKWKEFGNDLVASLPPELKGKVRTVPNITGENLWSDEELDVLDADYSHCLLAGIDRLRKLLGIGVLEKTTPARAADGWWPTDVPSELLSGKMAKMLEESLAEFYDAGLGAYSLQSVLEANRAYESWVHVYDGVIELMPAILSEHMLGLEPEDEPANAPVASKPKPKPIHKTGPSKAALKRLDTLVTRANNGRWRDPEPPKDTGAFVASHIEYLTEADFETMVGAAYGTSNSGFLFPLLTGLYRRVNATSRASLPQDATAAELRSSYEDAVKNHERNFKELTAFLKRVQATEKAVRQAKDNLLAEKKTLEAKVAELEDRLALVLTPRPSRLIRKRP